MSRSGVHIYGVVAYDGADYHGFQFQTGVPTIQGTLEEALTAFATVNGRVIGSGRTDAGVHAAGQVVGVCAHWKHSVADFQRAWNAHLPPSICVHQCGWAPPDFHPRFSALSRTYRYTVWQADEVQGRVKSLRSPLTDRYSLYVPYPLDVAAMNEAAVGLLGEHDFATFGQPPQGVNTIRSVSRADWQWVTDDLPALQPFPARKLVFTVTATAFLRQMVRNLVGSLLEVGRGRWSAEDMQRALEAKDRHRSAPPASPNGLVLEQVTYPVEMRIRH